MTFGSGGVCFSFNLLTFLVPLQWGKVFFGLSSIKRNPSEEEEGTALLVVVFSVFFFFLQPLGKASYNNPSERQLDVLVAPVHVCACHSVLEHSAVTRDFS